MSYQTSLDLLTHLIAKAKALGADAADAIMVSDSSLSARCRLGAVEKLERMEGSDIGLRVLIGKHQAFVSSTDRSPGALNDLVERAVAMARIVPEDPFCGLADPDQIAVDLPDIDSCDPFEPTADSLVALAQTCEAAARSVDGITNSDGAGAGWGRSDIATVASNGFARSYSLSHNSFSVAVLAGEGTHMERDYDYSGAVYASDLRTPEEVGLLAAERAISRLGARKVDTCAVPIVFSDRVARGLLSHLIGAISGPTVARGTSFLKDSLHQQIFAPGIRIIDDPHRPRGLRSRPCDAEGLPTRTIALVDDGVLQTWLLDLRSSRQLGLASTGHAARGIGSAPSPSPSNLYLEAGTQSLETMLGGIERGLYVTELFGQGVNTITGDYSRGAAGFWIENGHLAYPVSEITIAGNLKDMFATLTPANDLSFTYGIDSPSVRIDGMTVAGR